MRRCDQHTLSRFLVVRVQIGRELGEHVLSVGKQRHAVSKNAGANIIAGFLQYVGNRVLHENITVDVAIERVSWVTLHRRL